MFSLSVCLLLLLMTSGNAVARKPNAQHEAGGCASPEAQALNFLRGDWKVRSKFRLSRDPDRWEETLGRSTITYQFENCPLREQFKTTRQSHPFTATAMYAYNRNTKKYESVGVDSEHGVLTLYTGLMRETELVLESNVEISGQIILLRRVWTKNAAGGFEVRSQRSSDGGQTWDTPWYLNYSRK